MLSKAKRRTKIAMKRVKRGANPFALRHAGRRQARVLGRRRAKEKIFRACAAGAVVVSLLFLCSIAFSIVSNGWAAFFQTQVLLPLEQAESGRKAGLDALQELFPEGKRRKLSSVLSKQAYRDIENAGAAGEMWLMASSDFDLAYKHDAPERLDKQEAAWMQGLKEQGRIRTIFNAEFFTRADSQEPEQAGIEGSFLGSLFVVFVCILCALPICVAAALYLEEFAKKNWVSEWVEININNLAAVPSIIYGLLGLTIFIGFLGLPRSSAVVGGLVLALLILPVIVIATRNALRSVPKSIRYAALAMGATPVQVALHHTLPYALPGIVTGVILGVARALGETAPLIMIGMVAFITDAPSRLTDPATTLPVQIYLWSNNPESGFVEKTAAAIIVLLALLAVFNALAAWVRGRFEIKW